MHFRLGAQALGGRSRTRLEIQHERPIRNPQWLHPTGSQQNPRRLKIFILFYFKKVVIIKEFTGTMATSKPLSM